MTAVLYIIMRTDLESLNSGKGMAQASHASNAFVNKFHARMAETNFEGISKSSVAEDLNKAFYDWENSTTQGFGTVLVLEGKMSECKFAIDLFRMNDYIADIIHDPTYPIVDGEIVHYIPLDTCAYVFVPNKEQDYFAAMILKKFPLHR